MTVERYQRLTVDELEKAWDMFEQGSSTLDIALHFNVTESEVYNRLARIRKLVRALIPIPATKNFGT